MKFFGAQNALSKYALSQAVLPREELEREMQELARRGVVERLEQEPSSVYVTAPKTSVDNKHLHVCQAWAITLAPEEQKEILEFYRRMTKRKLSLDADEVTAAAAERLYESLRRHTDHFVPLEGKDD